MDDLNRAEIDAARQQGRADLANKPRAHSAHYDSRSDRVVIDLVNGATYMFPPKLVQGLERATPAQLGQVEILGMGFGLHWEELDVDLTIEGLMAGRFGTDRYMAQRFGSGPEAHAAE